MTDAKTTLALASAAAAIVCARLADAEAAADAVTRPTYASALTPGQESALRISWAAEYDARAMRAERVAELDAAALGADRDDGTLESAWAIANGTGEVRDAVGHVGGLLGDLLASCVDADVGRAEGEAATRAAIVGLLLCA